MVEAFIIIPAIVSGIIIGIYEVILVHRDVQLPSKRFIHGVHALVLSVIACFAVFNVPFVLSVIPALTKIPLIKNPLIFRIIIGLILFIKIHGVSAGIKSSVGGNIAGTKETWFHSILIGALIVVVPYIYPILAPMLPTWMR